VAEAGPGVIQAGRRGWQGGRPPSLVSDVNSTARQRWWRSCRFERGISS